MLAVLRRTGEKLLIEDIVLTVDVIEPQGVHMSLRKGEGLPVLVTLKTSQFIKGCYNVRIGLIRVQGDRVRLGFEVPPSVKIARL